MLRAVVRHLRGSKQLSSHLGLRSCRWLVMGLILSTIPVLARTTAAQQPTKPTTGAVPDFGGSDTIPPVISFNPAAGAVPSQTVPVTITWCDDKTLLSSSRHVYLNGGEVTSSFNYTSTTIPGCGAAAKSTGSVLLHQGKQSDTLLAVIEDNSFNMGSGTTTWSYVYAPPTPAPVYTVAVTPDNGQLIVAGNSTSTASFVVHNTSRNIGAQVLTYTLSASCTGTAFPSGCASLVPGSTSLSADSGMVATVSVNAAAAGTSGRIRLLATQSGKPTVSDSGWVAVTASTLTAGAPSVDVASVNPGTAIDRDLCLTVAAGESAARECGDLRIVHALPAVRTMNKLRTPYLLYNSQFAHPFPIVAANVGLGATTLPPDTVVATLTIGGLNYAHRLPASGFQAGVSRRVAVSFDGIASATGIYPYTLTVSTIYNASHSQFSTAVNDTLIVVNRAHSPFGAGWWFDGLEQLYFVSGDTSSTASQILWVGGDGSARLYARTSNGKWAARAIDRPDTLARVGSTWVRYAPHGVQVQFNGAGLHITTTNRLGHATRFSYSGSLLTSILFPTPAGGSIVKDSLVYSSGLLNSILSPGPTATGRTTSVAMTGNHLTSITDPDTAIVSFTYQTSAADTGRIATRNNALGFATAFAYDAAHRLASDNLDMGAPIPAVIQRFRDLDSVIFAAAPLPMAPESAYVRLDGPRTDVRDYEYFWLDRYGEPTRVVDALGDTTQLARSDSRWPALVTRAQYANGRVLLATYSARGNDSTSTDSVPVLGGTPATTRYLFEHKFDFMTRLVRPMQDSITLAYDSTTGNRLYQEPGSDATRRVVFTYDAATGLLRGVQAPLAPRADSLYYDHTIGNDTAEVSARGMRSYTTHDLAGRVIHTKAPIDSAQTLFTESDLGYDLADRPLSEQTYGPAIHYLFHWSQSLNGITTLANRQIVSRVYDREGNLKSLSRRSLPDTNHIGVVTTQWVYDRANRVVKEIAPDGKVDSTTRDPAGNAVASKTRRDSVGVITAHYDALNRLVERDVPAVMHQEITIQRVVPAMTQPRYTTGYYIPSDVETYGYDAAGNMTTAVNGSALVARSFNPDGTLATDTLRIRSYSSTDSSQHVYGLQYTYDPDKRRTALHHPRSIAPVVSGVVKDSEATTYDPVTGQLATVTDVLGDVFRYTYDLAGRLDTLASPGGIFEYRRYNADDEMTARVDSASAFVGQPGGFPRAAIHSDSLFYDARGKVIEARTLVDTARNGYGALGDVVDALELAGQFSVPKALTGLEEFYVNDALGNRAFAWRAQQNTNGLIDSVNTTTFAVYQPDTGRQTVVSALGSSLHQFSSVVYDEAGNRTAAVTREGGTEYTYTATAYFYDALNRLRALDKRSCEALTDGSGNDACDGTSYVPANDLPYFQEYRYDALGRRILVRSRSDSTCPASSNQCVSEITRTVYDGAQVLYEVQMPGGDTISASQLERDTTTIYAPFLLFGRVAYTQSSALDRPLSVIRMGYDATWPAPVAILPHTNWKGEFDSGAFSDGRALRCTDYSQGADTTCVVVQWPASFYGIFFQDIAQSLTLPSAWTGALLAQRRDATGQIYLRNRYYDPTTGRFTQEDPLGLAGGLNEYGYANGDPVNFSDPFGLTCQIVGNCTQSDGGVSEAVAHEKWVRSAQGVVDDPGLANPLLLVGGIEEKEGEAAIDVTEGALGHVTESHTAEGALSEGKSIFAKAEDLVGLVRKSESVQAVKQTFGRNFQRIVDAGRHIGVDRATGKPTSIYTVITNIKNELVTMFPGTPR